MFDMHGYKIINPQGSVLFNYALEPGEEHICIFPTKKTLYMGKPGPYKVRSYSAYCE